MRSHIAEVLFWATRTSLLFGIALGAADAAYPQTTQTVQTPIYVQAPRRSTVAGDWISAEADYVAAYGQFLQEAATARKINAEAVALEIDNWKKMIVTRDEMVDLYWKRWREAHPDYLTRQGNLQEIMQKRVEGQYQDTMRGDLSTLLNWLLHELSEPVMANRYLPENQVAASARLDRKLEKGELERIRLSDGGSKASRLIFPAGGENNVLQPHWPLALRSSEFDKLRKDYEQTVEQIVAEIKEKHEVSAASATKVMEELHALSESLENAYPKERRRNSAEYYDYLAATKFLLATLAATKRTISTPDALVRIGGLRFQGDSLVALMQHMYQSGLEFAPSEPGAEGVYRKLFDGMRGMYLEYRPNQAADGPKKASAKGAPAARGAAD